MNILDQKMKAEMEECKKRARMAGLVFGDDTLEYVVTNQDLLELDPKVMIPTLYDYWVHDVEVRKNKWIYDVYPHNPYETVINTRPPISFYNQDNADWFNVVIFYHVLGHIDMFQNNIHFRQTWNDDFCGQALADKRLLARIREELGEKKRFADYVIEFALAIDNLVGFFPELREADGEKSSEIFGAFSPKIDFYFGWFLRKHFEEKTINLKFYHDELERYSRFIKEHGKTIGEVKFFEDPRFLSKFPEFNTTFRKQKEKEKEQKPKPKDLFEHLLQNSEFLNKKENRWMQEVIQIVRRTSLYFQPSIRTHICHEGWASFWHERLFIADERMRGKETDYAKVDSGVALDPRIGINVYAVGRHLFEFIEDLAVKGKLSPDYQLLKGIEPRRRYDQHRGEAFGKQVLFEARKYFNDQLLINFLSDEDFQDFVDRYRLWTVGMRPSRKQWNMAELYIKSKSGKDYRRLLNRSLYHPPNLDFSGPKAKDGELYLNHVYEGRSLFTRHIKMVLIGLEFLWGKRVRLETTEYEPVQPQDWWDWWRERFDPKYRKKRVLYTCEYKKVARQVLEEKKEQTQEEMELM